MEIIEKFGENLNLCGIKENQIIVLGVSGGADSVTMLDLFIKSNLNLKLIVAHLNHGVREDAEKDEKLVKFIADKNNLDFVSKKINPPKGGNLEEELRIKRREFLLDVMTEYKTSFIALAHNANDQAETFFLNALRGSGSAGLSGMKIIDGVIARPLLNLERREIIEYAEANHLVWHEDTTNNNINYKRNYLRHKVFPMFTEINSSWLEAILRTSSLQREIDDHLKEKAEKYLIVPFDVKTVQGLNKPVLYEALGLLYEEAKGDRKDLTLQNLSDLEKLISSTSGTKSIALPGHITAIRRYNHLDFMLKMKYNNYSSVVLEKLEIGENFFSDWKVVAERVEISQFRANSRYSIAVDAETFPKLKVRNWKAGDKIQSFGVNGSKKLQDLFVDAKIVKDKRNTWPIFQLGKEIIWVPRLAISRNFIIKKSPTIKLTIEEIL